MKICFGALNNLVLVVFKVIFIAKGGLGPKILRSYRFFKGHIPEKASIPLKMYLKSLAILEKNSFSLKKSSKLIDNFIKVPHF
jgi:hypothetical protein